MQQLFMVIKTVDMVLAPVYSKIDQIRDALDSGFGFNLGFIQIN